MIHCTYSITYSLMCDDLYNVSVPPCTAILNKATCSEDMEAFRTHLPLLFITSYRTAQNGGRENFGESIVSEFWRGKRWRIQTVALS